MQLKEIMYSISLYQSKFNEEGDDEEWWRISQRVERIAGLLESSKVCGEDLMESNIGKIIFKIVILLAGGNPGKRSVNRSIGIDNKTVLSRDGKLISARLVRVLVCFNLQIFSRFIKPSQDIEASLTREKKKLGILDQSFYPKKNNIGNEPSSGYGFESSFKVSSPARNLKSFDSKTGSPIKVLKIQVDQSKELSFLERKSKEKDLDNLTIEPLISYSSPQKNQVGMSENSLSRNKASQSSKEQTPKQDGKSKLDTYAWDNISLDCNIGKRTFSQDSHQSSIDSNTKQTIKSEFSFGEKPSNTFFSVKQEFQGETQAEKVPAIYPTNQPPTNLYLNIPEHIYEELIENFDEAYIERILKNPNSLNSLTTPPRAKLEPVTLSKTRKRSCRAIYSILSSLLKQSPVNTVKAASLDIEHKIFSFIHSHNLSDSHYLHLVKHIASRLKHHL